MLKKTLCALLCALLMLSAAACSSSAPAADPTQAPEDTAQAEPASTPLPEDEQGADEPHYYTQDDPEYRELYSNNAIEAALDEEFTNAVTTEDFDALAKKYVAAWQDEYHALMADLIAAHPEDAEELQGLLEYTDEAAQQAWENTYAMNFYIDENGDEQPAPAAEQNANFDKAEVYKDATILSILNDYRGDAPYEFHYNAQ